ncbi:MAG: hypothetical protein DME19_05295 [Verrucomicrobia bacterium]|nr:MAG: hypothetical protein DME19_05295 [Verrucomicrobiota bacterium]
MLNPLPAEKWSYTTAAHLLNRAGFGGTPAEVERLLEMGPDRAVSSFVDYDKIPDTTPDPEWARPDPDRMEKFLALRRMNQELKQASGDKQKELEEKRREMQREQRQTQQQHLLELRGWWLERMAKGPRPLQEKLTLFWHGHFATSVQKVKDAYFMWLQNQTLRRHAMGNWLQLLTAVAKDPAMLIWLDQAESRKEHPNENFAREVMELFALGEGHYTEKDVTEAARALTGWALNRVQQKFEYRSAIHDPGIKTVLGRSGNLTGSDVIEQIAGHPQAARFICAKLWTFFAAENPTDELVSALADTFRRGNSYFQSPVQWLVGSVRVLECDLLPPIVSSNLLRSLGQDLFAPPNVKGWDGGIAWITTNNLLNRYNFAAFLVMGRNALPMIAADKQKARRIQERLNRINRRQTPVDCDKLFTADERSSKGRFLAALQKRFIQSELSSKQARAALREFLESERELTAEVMLDAVRLILCTPEYQLT